MLTAGVILFCYVALSGVLMAMQILRGIKPFKLLAVAHGILAGAALILLLLAAVPSGSAPLLRVAAATLALAALGGGLAVSFHMRGGIPPLGIVAAHALLALAGLGCLLWYWLY